jgi:hypothetical protein
MGISAQSSLWHRAIRDSLLRYAWRLCIIRPASASVSPMLILAFGIEHLLDVAAQRFHDSNKSKHCRPAEVGDQNQGGHCGLPLRGRCGRAPEDPTM